MCLSATCAESPPVDSRAAIHAWLEHGDQSAARWLVETHRPMVLRALRGWLPRSWMVEDVVQELFAKAFCALPRLDHGRRFEAWLFTIARNTCAKTLRSWRRRFVFNAADIGLTELEVGNIPCGSTEEGRPPRDHRVLRRLLARLQEQDRSIFRLYHGDGLTAHRVGERFGLSPGTVRARVCRSQRTLRMEAVKLRERGEI